VSTADRSGSTNVSYAALIAVESGVVVALQDTAMSDITPVAYWGMWSAGDGHQLWKGTLALGDARMVSNGTSLFASFKDPSKPDGVCCDLAEVNIVTGAVTWTRGTTEPISLYGFLSDEDTLIMRTVGIGESVQGLNVTTHEIDWTLSLSSTGCFNPMFPLSPEGLLPCFSNIGQLAVYQPVRTPATPAATAPQPPTSPASPSPQADTRWWLDRRSAA
jgi:hypothetical protein